MRQIERRKGWFGHSGVTEHFLADMHFGCGRNARLRGFPSASAMDDAIISAWRSRVSDDDVVWVLGDVGDLDPLRGLPGTKRLIFGNNDHPKADFRESGVFETCADSHILDTARGAILLIHRPNDAGRYRGMVLHGHTHDAPPQPDPRFVCVSVDQTRWGPIDLDEVMRRFKRRAGTSARSFL